MTAHRGTSNRNRRGSSEDRAVRRAWLVQTYRADVDAIDPEALGVRVSNLFGVPAGLVGTTERIPCAKGTGIPACRCYRCGRLLTVDTVTVDRIIPGCQGGTYRRNNIRPACGPCNSETGGALATRKAKAS